MRVFDGSTVFDVERLGCGFRWRHVTRGGQHGRWQPGVFKTALLAFEAARTTHLMAVRRAA